MKNQNFLLLAFCIPAVVEIIKQTGNSRPAVWLPCHVFLVISALASLWMSFKTFGCVPYSLLYSLLSLVGLYRSHIYNVYVCVCVPLQNIDIQIPFLVFPLWLQSYFFSRSDNIKKKKKAWTSFLTCFAILINTSLPGLCRNRCWRYLSLKYLL